MNKYWKRSLICISLATASTALLVVAAEAEETNSSVRRSPYFNAPVEDLQEQKRDKQKKRTQRQSVAQLEKHLFELVNKDRTASGVAPVKLSPELSRMAREHAQDMMKKEYFSHTSPEGLGTQQRAVRLKIRCPIFENLGDQSGPEPAVQMVDDLEQSFMDEPHDQKNHRYNLLHPQHIWVGVAVVQNDDHVIIAQEFSQEDPSNQAPDDQP